MPTGDRPEFIVRSTALAGLTLVAADSARRFDRHTHALHGIGVIDAGGQHSASGRGPVQALRGEVITVNPGEVHDGIPMQGQNRRWRMVHLDVALWDSERSAVEWTRPVLSDARVAALVGAVFACAAAGADALAVEERLALLLHHAPSTLGRTAPRPARADCGRALAQARERLAQALVPPSLAEMAREAAMSRTQFLRAFAAAFGRAQILGELPAEADCAALARRFQAAITALRFELQLGTEPSEITSMAQDFAKDIESLRLGRPH